MLLAAVATAAAFPAAALAGPPLLVKNLNDDGPGSLRRAVDLANKTPGADTVTFAPGLSGTIALTGGPITVASPVAIVGPGSAAVALSGGGAGRVLEVSPNASLRLSGLTVRDGRATLGGGLLVGKGAEATAEACAFAGNTATDGGAVFADGSVRLTLKGCLFTGNLAVHGGAVHANRSPLALTGSTFAGNGAYYAGSGVFAFGVPAVVDRCAFVGNQSADGAIALTESPGGRSRITNSLVAGNFTPGTGAILVFSNAHADIINCTVTGNTGGILTGTGIGVLAGVSGPSTANVANGIVWGNTSFGGPVAQIAALGGSGGSVVRTDLEGPLGPEFTASGLLSADPLFVRAPDPFAGDPGDLHLRAGSPAIDAGDTSLLPAGLTLDLDGAARVAGAAVDLGAYEFGAGVGAPAGVAARPAVGGLPPAGQAAAPPPSAPRGNGPRRVLVVRTLKDDGPGSLRQAVEQANRVPGANAVTFAPGLSGTIALTGGPITVCSPVSIEGPGAGVIAVSGRSAGRVFEAAGGAYLRLSGLTVRDGRAILGGGLLVNPGAEAEVAGCVFADNVADAEGGAIFSAEARLTVTGSTFTGNAALDGAGVYPDATSFRVTGSTFAGNRAFYGGAGVFVFGAPAVVDRCSFLGNQSADAALSFTHTVVAGGAAGKSLVTNSLVVGNVSPGAGSILVADLADADIVNCTVTGNIGGVISGAGISALSGISGPSVTTVTNSIVWGNGSFAPAPFVPAQIVSFSIPIQVSYSDVEIGTVDLFSGITVVPGVGNISADPLFVRNLNLFAGDLGDLRLRAGSPALNAGNTSLLPAGLTLDLYGGPRVLGPSVDMGALEGAAAP
jgi:predicted outer membrane repeat protein